MKEDPLVGTGKFTVKRTCVPLLASLSKSTKPLPFLGFKENFIGSFTQFDLDSNGSISGLSIIPISAKEIELLALILPSSSGSPTIIAPIDSGLGGANCELPFVAHSIASSNSFALLIGKATIWSALRSGIPSPSISLAGKSSSINVGIPSESAISEISTFTVIGPYFTTSWSVSTSSGTMKY